MALRSYSEFRKNLFSASLVAAKPKFSVDIGRECQGLSNRCCPRKYAYREAAPVNPTTKRKPLIFYSDPDDLGLDPPVGYKRSAGSECPTGQEYEPTVLATRSAQTLTEHDLELDIKHDLIELNKERTANKEIMQERFYQLHKLLVGTGRAGKFTPFLRDALGWPEKNAYDKAMRWVAAHQFRIGEIDEETYRRKTGNSTENTTLRSDSTDPAHSRPLAPPLTQEFTVEVTEVEESDTPQFTDEQLNENRSALEASEPAFVSAVLYRAVLPSAHKYWFDSAIRLQSRRLGTKTFRDTLFALALRGGQKAAEDDEWGRMHDDILADIAANPRGALVPDPSLRTHWEDEAEESSADITDVPAKAVFPFAELTLDDFPDFQL